MLYLIFFCLATKPSHLPPQRPRRWPQRPHTIINADATYLQPTSKPLSIEMAAAATAAEFCLSNPHKIHYELSISYSNKHASWNLRGCILVLRMLRPLYKAVEIIANAKQFIKNTL